MKLIPVSNTDFYFSLDVDMNELAPKNLFDYTEKELREIAAGLGVKSRKCDSKSEVVKRISRRIRFKKICTEFAGVADQLKR